MRNLYQKQLNELDELMVAMGELCEKAITVGVNALTESDTELIEKAHEIEREIDQMEMDIEQLCLKLLLLQSPVASDLRDISAALKMITDLERIGDQAYDIADISQFIPDFYENTELKNQIKSMSKVCIHMIQESITAFKERNLEIANRVPMEDYEVDNTFNKIKTALVNDISAGNTSGEYALDLLMIAKYLERIGDHATNLAEWVAFAITGNLKQA